MARVIPLAQDPADNILTNRTAISNNLHNIRRHVDGERILNDRNLGLLFDNTGGLNNILQSAQQLQGLPQRHANLQQNLDNIRAERDNLNNQVARQQVMINDAHGMLIGAQQEAVNLQAQLLRHIPALRHSNNALRQCREDKGLLEYNRD